MAACLDWMGRWEHDDNDAMIFMKRMPGGRVEQHTQRTYLLRLPILILPIIIYLYPSLLQQLLSACCFS